MRLEEKFIVEISKCKEPEVFLGLVRALNVRLYLEEKDADGRPIARPFGDMFADVVEAYNKASRKYKRDLLKVLKDANNAEV